MKKLIAAITVSFMMLGLMTGCGAEKSFDGDILDVISFDMSKQEIMEAAGKIFGEIKGAGKENPDDAERLIYVDSVYGYPGNIIFIFQSDLNTLKKIEVYYRLEADEEEEPYEDIINRFTDMYGPSIVEDKNSDLYISYKGKTEIVAYCYESYRYDEPDEITIQYGPSETWEEWLEF